MDTPIKSAMCYLFIYLFPGWGGHDLMGRV